MLRHFCNISILNIHHIHMVMLDSFFLPFCTYQSIAWYIYICTYRWRLDLRLPDTREWGSGRRPGWRGRGWPSWFAWPSTPPTPPAQTQPRRGRFSPNTWLHLVHGYDTWLRLLHWYDTWLRLSHGYDTWLRLVHGYNTWLILIHGYHAWMRRYEFYFF